MSHLDRQAQTKLHSKHVRFSDQQLVFALSNLMNILNTLKTLAVDFVPGPQFFQFSLLTHSDHVKLLYYIYNPLWKLGTAPAILDLLNRSQKTMERPLAVSSTQVPSMSDRGLQQTMQQHYSQQYENKRQRSLAKIAVFRRSEGIRGSMVQVQWCNSAVQL